MYISKVKVSEEFLNQNGRHLWLSCDVTLLEGEDNKEAFKMAADAVVENNKLLSEMPVIESKKMKSKMDMVILKKYNQALLEKDEVIIKQIESNYHVES